VRRKDQTKKALAEQQAKEKPTFRFYSRRSMALYIPEQLYSLLPAMLFATLAAAASCNRFLRIFRGMLTQHFSQGKHNAALARGSGVRVTPLCIL